jgi:hypothetical protein
VAGVKLATCHRHTPQIHHKERKVGRTRCEVPLKWTSLTPPLLPISFWLTGRAAVPIQHGMQPRSSPKTWTLTKSQEAKTCPYGDNCMHDALVESLHFGSHNPHLP